MWQAGRQADRKRWLQLMFNSIFISIKDLKWNVLIGFQLYLRSSKDNWNEVCHTTELGI